MSEAYDGPQIVGMDLHRRRGAGQDDRGWPEAGDRADHQQPGALPARSPGGEAPQGGAGGDVRLVLGGGHAGGGRCGGAPGAPAGGEGLRYRRVKNDEQDAADLADLLRMGRLPEAWIAPAEIRELREITRYRIKLVRPHQLQGPGPRGAGQARHRGDPSDIFGVWGNAWLDELRCPSRTRGRSPRCGSWPVS